MFCLRGASFFSCTSPSRLSVPEGAALCCNLHRLPRTCAVVECSCQRQDDRQLLMSQHGTQSSPTSSLGKRSAARWSSSRPQVTQKKRTHLREKACGGCGGCGCLGRCLVRVCTRHTACTEPKLIQKNKQGLGPVHAPLPLGINMLPLLRTRNLQSLPYTHVRL